MKNYYNHLDHYSLLLSLWQNGKLNTSSISDIDYEIMVTLSIEESRKKEEDKKWDKIVADKVDSFNRK